MQLKGKVALITGAGSGIGESTAILFAQEGAKVVLTDLNSDAISAVAERIVADGGKAHAMTADVSNPKDSERSVNAALEQFGRLDVAVNNAGIAGPAQAIGAYDIEAWNKVIAVNLSGVFYGMRYQIPVMEKIGGGSIINVTSILGQVGFAMSSAYVAAKHGIVGLTKNGALEYAAKGIRVNAVGPAFIKTPLLDQNLSEAQMQQIAAMHPIGRLGKPEEVAELFLFLAGSKSAFINGAYYAIDGGYLAQ